MFAVAVAIAFLDHQRDVHAHAGFGRHRLTQQFKVTVADPVAEELVGRLDGRRSSLQADKIERTDRGFEAYLLQFISFSIFHALSQSVHYSLRKKIVVKRKLELNYSQVINSC